ncbi:hypothetical protein Ndes2526B_g00857 [Nannochloris sp. 'desiccata']
MRSTGRPLGAPARGPSHLKNNSNALPGVYRSTLRMIPHRTRRIHSLETLAFGGDPYEPLEKAINIINKVLSAGESKSKKGANSNSGNGGGGRERWVQFGTVASARLSLQDLTAKDAELDREATSRLLQEYLSLPVEEYSLLDPKWVVREEQLAIDFNLASGFQKNSKNNTFRVSIPLQDMLGVDICPQVSIEARPDPLNSQVTLIGTKAVLGSPGFDDMFKLKLVAVMRCRRKDRHLPGRPVQRLRQWAAKRRTNGGTNSVNFGGSGLREARGASSESDDGGGGGGTAVVAEVVDVDAFSDLDQANFSKVSSSYDEDEEEAGAVNGFSTRDEGACVADSSSFRFSTDLSNGEDTSSSNNSYASSSFSGTDADSEEHPRNRVSSLTTSAVAAHAPLLDCKVQINMAVKVPGALRVVPNGLLGYAGSVITKTVLNAVLPNFLQLLSNDFKQWVAAGGRRKEENDNSSSSNGEGDVDGNSGSLFTPLISSASSGSERTDI